MEPTPPRAAGPPYATPFRATAVVPPPVPTILKAPTINGEARQGQTLTEVHGSWTNSPTSFSYQWLQGNTEELLASRKPISGPIQQEYAPVARELGHNLRAEG